MEPITHALASLALARAGLGRVVPRATPLLVVSGLVADLDWLSLAGGARAYLEYHRTMTHSILGSAALAAGVAAGWWWLRRRSRQPARFSTALAVSLIGSAAHLLLDLANPHGVQLFWPFRRKWQAWDLMPEVDPWVLLLLLVGLLLPGLFRLVTEEIGARPAQRGPQRWAVVALALVALYGVARGVLHERAAGTLAARMYRGAAPRAVGAFPAGVSPLAWLGVVETENTLHIVEVSLAPGAFLDLEGGRTHFKPEPSPALEAARATETVRSFLQFARFPLASVERSPEGYRVTLRDLRFSAGVAGGRDIRAAVELDTRFRVREEKLEFSSPKKP